MSECHESIYYAVIVYCIYVNNVCEELCKKIKRVVKFTMYHIWVYCAKLLKTISKLTLSKLIWTVVFIVLLMIIGNWKNDKDVTVIRSVGNPVIMWWNFNVHLSNDTRNCASNVKCDIINNGTNIEFNKVQAFILYASNIDFHKLPLPRRPRDVIWGLFHEESPRNVVELSHEETLKLFNFSSTFSRYSDIPFPLQHLKSKMAITTKKYFVPTAEKNKYLNEISSVMYLQTDCETSTERDTYVKELMKYIDVDSYGGCINNKQLPEKFTVDYLNNLDEDSFLHFVARYKFVIAIENGVCYDYVTEKFWRPIQVGSVPIYFGSPTVKDWFPNEKSAILLEDYPSPQLMADHLKKISLNDTLYEQYLEHKTKESITNQRLLEELSTREYQMDALLVAEKFECFICEKLHSATDNNKNTVNIVNQSHYDCPKPISALTLNVNPVNDWVHFWNSARREAEIIYKTVISN